MSNHTPSLWNRFQSYFIRYNDLGISLDVSRMRFPDDLFSSLNARIRSSFESMTALEKGSIANPDEGRMVGHYWLRAPELSPSVDLNQIIGKTIADIHDFSRSIHQGTLKTPAGKTFKNVVVIGIGGSALGPQLVADALGTPADKMKVYYLDNTDPDGIDRVFDHIGAGIDETLCVVISKSGGTKETRNGMLEAKARYDKAGLAYSKFFVAVTGDDSELFKFATKEKWITLFPMWDWVGGRTSVMSAVGLLPMALQGLDIDAFLKGAAAMDVKTRVPQLSKNASMMLALMWHYAGNGKGEKDMVILPYKDRLVLMSKYLQQLVMESLGKEKDLDGKTVHQGIAVYGNKGSTDQHAYVQQLRDGVHNFFVTFIEVRKERKTALSEVEAGITSGDYLQGFLRGTRSALYEGGRDSITISIPEVNAFTLGALISLYERAVGFYATLVNINAYHQPGVEAGKKAATKVLQNQLEVAFVLQNNKGVGLSAEAVALKAEIDPEEAFHILHSMAGNGKVAVQLGSGPGSDLFSA
jgi:glucose-6-phosphate isomerase